MSSGPYGSWRSAIPATLVAGSGRQPRYDFGHIALDGSDVYWIERRAAEGGRNAIVRHRRGTALTDVLPAELSARSRVHEYGGGDFTVADGTVYFSNDADQRLYRCVAGDPAVALTPAAAARYADAAVDRRRHRLICVREDHHSGAHEPVNMLVTVGVTRCEPPHVLVAGYDFYAAPRLSPDGAQLAWLCWNHPYMPWDHTELWLVALNADGAIQTPRRIAGGMRESIFAPEWSPDGVLHFVSDRTGWWNLYRWHGDQSEPLCPMAAEFGVPLWNLGAATYAFASPRQIICAYSDAGVWHLAMLDTRTGTLSPIDTPYTDIAQVRAAAERAVFRAGGPITPTAIVAFDLQHRTSAVLQHSTTATIDPSYLSAPEPIAFGIGGGTAHGLFYPPCNPACVPRPQERPPLLVLTHGGPTAAVSTALDLKIQYWTSRGLAVLAVNYRGSSGYGRAYRDALYGQWGVADVDDCVNAARAMVQSGAVDGSRLIIRGSSAGGYTALCAVTFRDVFHAAASYYGISDLEALVAETHKFEVHYTQRLVGAPPERRAVYAARSPIHHVDRIACPVILLQGLDDRVVPPSQSARMAEALHAKHVPVAALTFPEEGHGFRRAETIARALEAELYFFSRVFGLVPADELEPIAIDGL